MIVDNCYIVLLLSLYRPGTLVTWILIVLTELNNNIKRQLTLGLGKIDGGDNACILGGPTIQVAQTTFGSTTVFRGMTDISSVYCSTVLL